MSAGNRARTEEDRRGIASYAKGAALLRLGARLRKARQGLGMTQSEAAGEIGFSTQTVRNWEVGRHEPRPARSGNWQASMERERRNSWRTWTLPFGNPVSNKPKFPYDRVNVDPEKLSRALREAGLTQEAVSGMTGISLSAMRRYEQGTNMPSTLMLEALASVYNKPAGWFMPLGHFTEEEDRLYRESVGRGAREGRWTSW